MLQHLIIQFSIYYLSPGVVAYGRLKTKENFKHLALKVVAVSYERWSLMRRKTWKLIFWKTGRQVACERTRISGCHWFRRRQPTAGNTSAFAG